MIQCVCGDSDAPDPDWDEDEGDILYENHTEVKLEDFVCVECSAAIPAGEEHDYIWGVWEGEEMTFRTCMPCARVRNDFCCDGYTIGNLWMTLREAYRDSKSGDDLEWLVP